MVSIEKIKVGWFSFSCCEDSTIVFTELLNTYYDEWKKVIEIKAAKVLKKSEDISDLDIAFVEGAIATKKDLDKLKEIRKNSKYLVAIGACACDGMPSAQRNLFNEKLKKEIEPEVKMYGMLEKSVPLKEVVKVDEFVDGCPMNEKIFLQTVDKLVKQLSEDNA